MPHGGIILGIELLGCFMIIGDDEETFCVALPDFFKAETKKREQEKKEKIRRQYMKKLSEQTGIILD